MVLLTLNNASSDPVYLCGKNVLCMIRDNRPEYGGRGCAIYMADGSHWYVQEPLDDACKKVIEDQKQ